MRTTLALSLTAGSALAAGAGVADTPVVVAPFEVLDSHPLCAGPGRIPFRVAFDVKGAPARFGIVGEDWAGTCEIKTRRGSEVKRIPIPCPDAELAETAAAKALNSLPRAANLTGKVVACLGVNDISFVEGSWTLAAATPLGAVVEQGDLSSPDLTVIFDGPISGSADVGTSKRPASAAVLAIVWDGVDVALADQSGARFEVSSYLALSPAEVTSGICGEARCRVDGSAGWTVRMLGGRRILDLVDYVDGA